MNWIFMVLFLFLEHNNTRLYSSPTNSFICEPSTSTQSFHSSSCFPTNIVNCSYTQNISTLWTAICFSWRLFSAMIYVSGTVSIPISFLQVLRLKLLIFYVHLIDCVLMYLSDCIKWDLWRLFWSICKFSKTEFWLRGLGFVLCNFFLINLNLISWNIWSFW